MKSPSLRAGLQASLLAALTVAFFAPGIFLAKLPVFRDLLVLVLPLRRYTADALWGGELPLWIPELFLGLPYLANYQSGTLYPPSLLAAVTPASIGLSLYLAFHVFVAGFGAARYMERVVGLGSPAALFGGLTFAFGGFFFSLISLTNQLAAAAWLPWVMLTSNRLFCRPSVGAFATLCLWIALQLLAGAPEAAILTAALVVADLARPTLAERNGPHRAAAVGAAFLVAAGVCAAQLLPTLDYVRQSSRAGGLPFAEVAAEAFEPASFLQFLLPHTFEGGAPGFMPEPGVPLFWSFYLGVAPFTLIVVALASRPSRYWVSVAGIAVLLAMGNHSFLLPTLHALAPELVGSFRYAGKFFLPAHFALAVLAALGFGAVLDSSRARRLALAAVILLAVVGVAVSVLVARHPEGALRALGYDLRQGLSSETYATIGAQVVGKGERLALFALVNGAMLWLVLKKRLGTTAFAGLMAFATFLDLFAVHQPSLVFTRLDSSPDRGSEAPALRAGQRVFHYARDPQGRLTPWLGSIRIADPVDARASSLWEANVPNLPLLQGASAVAGVDGFVPLVRADFYRVLATLDTDEAIRFLATFGVERLVGQASLDEALGSPRWARDDPPLRIYDLSEVVPRTYLAQRATVTADRLEALRRLSRPEFRPGRDVVLVGAQEQEVLLGEGTIEEVSFARHSVRARLTMAAEGLWVVSDTWSPDWVATVDDIPAEIVPVNGIVRGVRVPAGKHDLEMRYRPASFRIGAWISILMLGALLPIGGLVIRFGTVRSVGFRERTTLAGLLIATFLLPVILMTGKSITHDEVAHLPAGYSYLRTGAIRLNPMHPPLVKEICALPLLFLDADLPVPSPTTALPITAQWEYGRRFLDRPELEKILFRGRLMAVLLSLGLAIVLSIWARALWGPAGAALALVLYALDPTITAHAQLVTTDVGLAFFTIAYLFLLRRFTLYPSAIRLLLAGTALGLALGAKFSALALLPTSSVLLALAAWLEPQRFGRDSRAQALLGALGIWSVMVAIAYVTLWAIYLFPNDPLFYVRGLQAVNLDHGPHDFFFHGQLSEHRWPSYFLVAWLVKTPIPTLLLLAGALVALAAGRRARLLDEAFLALPAIVYFVAYAAFADPIGIRYLIPCFPFLYLFAGRLAPTVAAIPRARLAVAGLLAWLLVEYVSIWPNHLAYFNQLAGGVRGGVVWLDDSNVDWGQGMIQLRDYVRERGLGRYRVALLPTIDRARYQIRGETIGLIELLSPPRETLILSAHVVARTRALLERLYGDAPENWLVHVAPSALVGGSYYVYELGAALDG